ncbi:acetyl-CoA synthetase-like protein [Xylariaceae sp. FL0662B]|nr:acetyl-CoA synthetase-like protein [Xylariaceae sp. FL0662B]
MASSGRPAYGRRLLPSVLDELSEAQPDRIYAAVPKSTDVTEGFRDITIADIARCVNFMAGTKLLYASEISPLVKKLPELSAHAEVIPTFNEMMNSSPDPYAFSKTFDEARNEPAAVLQSSGSTGPPKLITMTHEIPGRKKRGWTIWTFDGEARVYNVFPFFHLGGFLPTVAVATVFNTTSIVLGPPNVIPDGSLLMKIMSQQKLRAMLLPPSVVEQMLLEPNTIDFFRGLDFVAYSGGPFNPKTGGELSKIVELISPYGAIETFVLPELAGARDDWEWHEFSPFLKHEMRAFDFTKSTYKLVLFSDESTKNTAAIYHTLPGVAEYQTKDLFTRHPNKPQLFKYYGRKDDIIEYIQNHPLLGGALVVGDGKTQAAIIVEPKEPLDQNAQAKLLQTIWPDIETSNTLIAGPGRIHHGMVICASPDKPFTRTGKGTIIRKLTTETYKSDIDRLYSGIISDDMAVSVSLKPSLELSYERHAVVDFLRSILAISFADGATIGEDEDFYAHGLDSIQTLSIVSNLRRSIRDRTSAPVDWISPGTIIQNSTINELSCLFERFLNSGIVDDEDSDDFSRVHITNNTMTKYLKSLPAKPTLPRVSNSSNTQTTTLIGSTGYLGTYIIIRLLKNPNVFRIYCLNRGINAEEIQTTSLRDVYGSIAPFLHKVAYITVKLGQPFFGLAEDEYKLLANEVDVIIYNSWRLDFGLAIRSFSPFLRATRDLVDLSASSKRNMRIILISSVSSVAAMAQRTTAPEAPVQDPLASVNNGYGQSKLAAERILAAAADRLGILVTVPWISTLLRTSKTLRCIPDHVAPVDWIPVDIVSSMLHDFILQPAQTQNQIRFYNICHPEPEPWELLVGVARDLLGIHETVPLKKWTKRLKDVT